MCSLFSAPITLEFCIVLCWDQYETHYGAGNLDNLLSIQALSVAWIVLNLNIVISVLQWIYLVLKVTYLTSSISMKYLSACTSPS